MSKLKIVPNLPPYNYLSDLYQSDPQNTESDDSSVHDLPNSSDEINLLSDLFFNLKTTTKTDWSNINIERRHDSKFWADVTHNFGFDILKSVFSISSSYFDNHDSTTYHIKSIYGDHLCPGSNYTMTLKNEVAFHLLAGMIENRIPGSLRLIIRGNGYSFFENRINELLSSKDVNQEALCHNMNALVTLFPYLIEYKSVNIANVCFKFVSSKLWKYMWAYLGVRLKTESNVHDEKMLLTFLELASTVLYGSRGPGFMERLNTSSSSYLWNSIIPLISWSTEKKILCRIISFVTDIFLMCLSDRCHETIPKDAIKVLKHNVNRCLERANEEGLETMELISNKDFSTYHSKQCVSMLQTLDKILDSKPKDLGNSIEQIYELSTLGASRLIVPYNSKNIFEPEKPSFFLGFSGSKIFPRVLPCFNFECGRVYHIDLPQLHLVNNDKVNFFYCPRCGIPSYCSQRCYEQHWQLCHKEVCPYFMNFPTFAKYFPKSEMDILCTVQDSNFNCVENDSKNNWKLSDNFGILSTMDPDHPYQHHFDDPMIILILRFHLESPDQTI